MPAGRGCGRAWAALGVVNAIGSRGYGAAASLGLETVVCVEACSSPGGTIITRGEHVPVDPGILAAVADVVGRWAGRRPQPLCARGSSSIPLEAGLKGSSALINALVEAAARLYTGYAPRGLELARLGVEAARAAGLTITGALDDHMAVSGCGGYATDNKRQAIVAHEPRLEGYAAIIVRGRRSIRAIDPSAYTGYRELFYKAWRTAVAGEWGVAALLNGLASLAAGGEESLASALLAALGSPRVYGAGVTGKGPSLYVWAAEEAAARRAAEKLRDLTGGTLVIAKLRPCTKAGESLAEQEISP